MRVEIKNTKWHDRLKGGKADGKKPSDYNPDELNVGAKVQREHTNDPKIATEISMDHEEENPTYYDELIMSGIADEQDAIDTYGKIKSDDDKKKAIDKIQKHLDKERDKLDVKERHILRFQEYLSERKK
jgi:rubrerythrin